MIRFHGIAQRVGMSLPFDDVATCRRSLRQLLLSSSSLGLGGASVTEPAAPLTTRAPHDPAAGGAGRVAGIELLVSRKALEHAMANYTRNVCQVVQMPTATNPAKTRLAARSERISLIIIAPVFDAGHCP